MLLLVDTSSLTRACRAREAHIRELLRRLALHADGLEVVLLGWPRRLGDPGSFLAPLPRAVEARLRASIADWDLARALSAGEAVFYSPFGVPAPPDRIRRALAACPWVATLPLLPARGAERCARVLAWTRSGAELALRDGVYPTQLRWLPPALEGAGARQRRRRETVQVPRGPYVTMSWPTAQPSARSHAEALRHIGAFRKARQRLPGPVGLVVLGAPSLVARARGWLGWGPHVRLLGPLDDFERERVIGSSQAWLHTGLEPESLLETAEALRLGVPVVAPCRAELRETFGQAARYYVAGDRSGLAVELEELLADDSLRRALAQRGIARARAFTWEAAARQLLDLFAELLRESRALAQPAAAPVEEAWQLALARR